ncbi:MAG: methylmalonyl-CoA mutase family protein, partial [Burkholderiales bacterium]|nr:methylmalonyl-CoA mutase family protein [Burkholderiales bacterium]
MTDLSVSSNLTIYKPKHKVRFVTAASLFDGHDASINIMRRILQGTGCEVIHLGHNRSVEEVVTAALQEDVQGIAISSYQGGHVEYFKYMLDLLRERGGGEIKVFGGGGGVIVPEEIAELHAYGVSRIYSPEDGQKMGLQGMINDMVMRCDVELPHFAKRELDEVKKGDRRKLAQLITALENNTGEGKGSPATSVADAKLREAVTKDAEELDIPTLGITGTGGSGKSSLTDELIRRFRLDQDDSLDIAVIAVDPSRRKSGGALLGDRIRMNAINGSHIFMRSLATRATGSEISAALPEVLAACKLAGFDLIVVETSGIGQGDAAIVPLVDVSLYVMTPEFGAASQLEKIDMLDFADFVAINKYDRKGGADALRDVRKQYQRNIDAFKFPPETMPVFGTIAARFNDDGVTALYQHLVPHLAEHGLKVKPGKLPKVEVRASSNQAVVVPPQRSRYLAEIAECVRGYHKFASEQSHLARERQQLTATKLMLLADASASPATPPLKKGADSPQASGGILQKGADSPTASGGISAVADTLDPLIHARDAKLDARAKKLLDMWPQMQKAYAGDEYVVKIRGKEVRTKLTSKSLSGSTIRKVALPRYEDHGELLKWLLLENVPGSFPYTAGVFAFKRENEDPTRMFAGEGDPFRTN